MHRPALMVSSSTIPAASMYEACLSPLSPHLTQGVVEFIDCALRYRPGLPLVLRGVSFRVEAGRKVRGCHQQNRLCCLTTWDGCELLVTLRGLKMHIYSVATF